MGKFILAFALLPLLLTSAQPVALDARNRVPLTAQLAVERDYLEWMRLPRWAGDCVDMPVVGITWIEPEGVEGRRPVLWLKEHGTGRYGAILGLTDSQLKSLGASIPAEPVFILPDVSIYRLCRPWTAGY